MVHLSEQITNARTLGDLLDAVNNWGGCDCLRCENTLCNLPVFGGEEPVDTTGIWSWDKDRLLVGESLPFVIIPREDDY